MSSGHRSRDLLIVHMPFPIGGPLEWSLNPAVFEILRSKRVLGHEFDLSRDHSIAHMPFPIGGPLEPSLCL